MFGNVKISAIVTCHDLEKYIARAIHSCLNQTLDDSKYEVIVVDDASTDGSWEIIKSFGSLIKRVKFEENRGVAAASNAGLALAGGRYVVRVDGDDFINRNMFLFLTEFLDWNDNIPFVWCDQIVVDDDGDRVQQINTFERLLDNGAGVAFRRGHMNEIGGYNEVLRTREDYDLITRYVEKFGEGTRIPIPYYRYHKREGSLSTMKLHTDTKDVMDAGLVIVHHGIRLKRANRPELQGPSRITTVKAHNTQLRIERQRSSFAKNSPASIANGLRNVKFQKNHDVLACEPELKQVCLEALDLL